MGKWIINGVDQGRLTDQAPADPGAADEVLAHQPVGYWSGLVHEVVTRRLRDRMARLDVTQPMYWVLNRVAGDEEAPAREDVGAQLTPLAEGPYEIARVVEQLAYRGRLRVGARGELYLTEEGEAARVRLRGVVSEFRAEVHRGIGDEEYVAALKVLRRMVANVEGEAP